MRIVIVGGGATGTIAAAHLARRPELSRDADIVIVEPEAALGRGLAYATTDPRHLLNVRVANMSAFPDAPRHLYDWLQAHGGAPCPTPYCFISRGRYGDYLADLAERTLAAGPVRHVRDACVDIEETGDGATVRLGSGATIAADHVILATGNDAKPAVNGLPAEQPWTPGSLDGLAPDAPILLIGAGLTMVDMALSLDRRGHRGALVAVSRRGLLPAAHRDTTAFAVAADEIPFGAEASALLAWVRALAARFAAQGGDWRAAIDALRPHTQRLWRAMTPDQRRRILRHAGVYWDVHRHRMAPAIERALTRLRDEGRFRLIAGRVLGVRRDGDALIATILPRGAAAAEDRAFARIIDCTGLAADPLRSTNPLIRTLLARGVIRPDPLGIGLDVADTYAVVGVGGARSERIRAIGPLARAAFWECIAIPDIRVQCQEVADALAGGAGGANRVSPPLLASR